MTEPPSAGATVPAVTTHDYSPRDEHVLQIDPSGRRIEYRYDPVGRLTDEISPELHLQYHYDATGNKTEAIDPNGTTGYSYDLLGRLTEVRYPGGEVENYTYDPAGNMLTKTDSSGTTTYTYDEANRLTSTTDPTGTRTVYRYNEVGERVAELVDGQLTQAAYDDGGRLNAYTDSLGYQYGYTYDADDRLTSRSGPPFQTSLAYNEAGRVTDVRTTAGGRVLTEAAYTYNDRNLVQTVAEDGRPYEYRYDGRDQITVVVTPTGDVIRYAFDGSGNRVRREAVINGREADLGKTITAEELIKLILKKLDGNQGGPGNKGQGKGKGGGTAGAGSAGDEPVTGQSTSGLAGDETLLAMAGGNGNGNGNGNGGTSGNAGGNGNGKGAGQDGAPGQNKDGDNGNGNGKGNAGGNGNGKDDKLTGRLNALTRGNGLKIGLLRKFAADQQGIVAEIVMILERIVNGETHVPPGTTAGLEAKVREAAAGYTLVGQEFEYNDLNQLTSVYDPIRDETFDYTWTAAGGLAKTGTADLSWNGQGRLAKLVWADGSGIEFTYDAQGRRLTKTTFNQNGEGRQMTTFHYLAGTREVLYEEGPDGLRLDYTYDADGRRLTMTVNGQSYWYVYNGHGDVVGLVDAQGSLVARYEYDDYGRIVHMWGADGREVRMGQGQIHYLNGDITVGDVSPEETGTPGTNNHGKGQGKKDADSITDPAAGPTADGDIAPGPADRPGKGKAGETAQTIETVYSTADEVVKLNPYRYAGYRYDWETELYFLQSRYYDSWSNRFVSRDNNIGQADRPLTLNRYIYALNDPIEFLDANGETPAHAYYVLWAYNKHIESLAQRYNLPADLIKSVVWNENRMRWAWHQAKDFGGIILGNASLGETQMQMATAAFLDTQPSPESLRSISTEAFDRMRFDSLNRLSRTEKWELAAKLILDKKQNIEYAARYLSLIRDVTGLDPYADTGAQTILSDYNRAPDYWLEEPSNYGRLYREYKIWWARLKYLWSQNLPYLEW